MGSEFFLDEADRHGIAAMECDLAIDALIDAGLGSVPGLLSVIVALRDKHTGTAAEYRALAAR